MAHNTCAPSFSPSSVSLAGKKRSGHRAMSVRRAGSAAAWRGLTYSRPRRASEARRGERWHFQPRSAGSLSSSMCAHAPLPHSISPPSPPPPPPMHRAWGFLWRLAGELWQSATPFQPPSRLWSEIQVCLILKTAPSLSQNVLYLAFHLSILFIPVLYVCENKDTTL